MNDKQLRAALEAASLEPDFNICGRCKHYGGDHDLSNWCLVCPRPTPVVSGFEGRMAAGWCFFSSMDLDEQWAHAIALFRRAADALEAAL